MDIIRGVVKFKKIFSDTRNNMIHTFSNIKFNNENVVGYLMIRNLIYCMILKRANFNNKEIEIMVKTFLDY